MQWQRSKTLALGSVLLGASMYFGVNMYSTNRLALLRDQLERTDEEFEFNLYISFYYIFLCVWIGVLLIMIHRIIHAVSRKQIFQETALFCLGQVYFMMLLLWFVAEKYWYWHLNWL